VLITRSIIARFIAILSEREISASLWRIAVCKKSPVRQYRNLITGVRSLRRRILDIGGQARAVQKLRRDIEYRELNRKKVKRGDRKGNGRYSTSQIYYRPWGCRNSFFFPPLSLFIFYIGAPTIFSQQDLIHEKARCFSCWQ